MFLTTFLNAAFADTPWVALMFLSVAILLLAFALRARAVPARNLTTVGAHEEARESGSAAC